MDTGKTEDTQQAQPEKKGERSPMTTGAIVLLIIVLVLLGIYFFTRSDSGDLQELSPTIGTT